MKEPKTSFTIRIPLSLANQIEARARILERSRNFVISNMLMKAIDEGVERDLNLLRSSAGPKA